MQKEFTIDVPDQLWVDSWTEGKTQTWTYNGPDKFYVVISNILSVSRWSEEPIEIAESQISLESVVEVDAATHTAVAFWLATQPEEITHEFEEETNPDGSTYNRITNPRIQDMFYPVYDPSQEAVVLKLITRKTDTLPEIKAKERLAYVNKFNGVYGFSDEVQTAIDQFVTDTEAYLESMKDIYPWKYVTVSETNVPKIPAIVVAEFAKVPVPGSKM